jgi:hypothetical protein
MGGINRSPAWGWEHNLRAIARCRLARKGRADHEYAAFRPFVSGDVLPVDDAGATEDFGNCIVECLSARQIARAKSSHGLHDFSSSSILSTIHSNTH